MKHKNIGDSFDSFLEDEGILEKVEEVAIKKSYCTPTEGGNAEKKIVQETYGRNNENKPVFS